MREKLPAANRCPSTDSEVPVSAAHARTREDHSTEVAEDYVEAIADMIQRTGRCRSVDLASSFAIAHATVNKTVGRLCRDGLVRTTPYGPIELTAAGIELANACRERHEIVLAFLLAIGVDEKTAVLDSEGIEHHVSQVTLEAMKRFLGLKPRRGEMDR